MVIQHISVYAGFLCLQKQKKSAIHIGLQTINIFGMK